MSDYRKTKAWREANPEKYREWRKTYMREYMARRRSRGSAPTAEAAPAIKSVVPVIEPAPVPIPEVKPALAPVEPPADKLARLLAIGKAAREAELTRVEVEPVSAVEELAGMAVLQECVDRAPEPMTQRRWKKMNEVQRRRHLAEVGVDTEEKMAEYLGELPG